MGRGPETTDGDAEVVADMSTRDSRPPSSPHPQGIQDLKVILSWLSEKGKQRALQYYGQGGMSSGAIAMAIASDIVSEFKW